MKSTSNGNQCVLFAAHRFVYFAEHYLISASKFSYMLDV